VVGKADIDLATLDAHDHPEFASVARRLRFQAPQPVCRRRFTLQQAHGGNERLKGGVGRRPADTQTRIGQGHDVRRDVVLPQPSSEIGQSANASRNGRPVVVAELRAQQVDEIRRQRLRQTCIVHQPNGAGIHRPEDIGAAHAGTGLGNDGVRQ